MDESRNSKGTPGEKSFVYIQRGLCFGLLISRLKHDSSMPMMTFFCLNSFLSATYNLDIVVALEVLIFLA